MEIDPRNYRPRELEARGILYSSTLAKNKVYQAISAAANAVEYAPERGEEELAESLYNSIYGHITGLLNIAPINNCMDAVHVCFHGSVIY